MATAGDGERDLSKCYGHHKEQTLQYAMQNCLSCRKLKTCVQQTWGGDRRRRWRREDWWEVQPARAGRRPPWPSSPPSSTKQPAS